MKERFNQMVMPEPNTGCWIWFASLNAVGYGQISKNGIQYGAHRASWEIFKGSIPDGLQVCHTCDNRWCVNPDHLFLGTHQDNSQDMIAKGRGLVREKNGATKLTQLQVDQIQKDGRPQRVIAREYGVSQPLISLLKQTK